MFKFFILHHPSPKRRQNLQAFKDRKAFIACFYCLGKSDDGDK